jgi:hypothetical protein
MYVGNVEPSQERLKVMARHKDRMQMAVLLILR